MSTDKGFFKAAISGSGGWRKYTESFSREQLLQAKEALSLIMPEVRSHLLSAESAQQDVIDRLKSLDKDEERLRKTQRKGQARISLRNFLSGEAEIVDKPLRDLQLCTKTGAAVRLDALVFLIAEKKIDVSTVNSAKEMLKHQYVCWADFNLYYVLNGQRSAGFCWDRPFLDELFVI